MFLSFLLSASGSYGFFVNSLADGYFQAHGLSDIYFNELFDTMTGFEPAL